VPTASATHSDAAATVVSPFIVGSLMASYQLPGVVWLMIGRVVVVVVWAWGVEPSNRGLEDVAAAKA
jgi:putative MFS transporter